MPGRIRPNSRVKDFVDIALLIQRGGLEPERVKVSIDAVFSRRKTHQFPEKLNPPSDDWGPVFEKMAKECNVNADIDRTFNTLVNFVESLR